MDIQALSKIYKVSIIKESDVPAVYELCLGNPQYYEYCPPAVSMESIRADMQALPPGKTAKIALAFFILVCTVMFILSGMVFMPLIKYAFKLYPSQAYHKIEDAGQIVFWDYHDFKFIPYRRGFWGLKRLLSPMKNIFSIKKLNMGVK